MRCLFGTEQTGGTVLPSSQAGKNSNSASDIYRLRSALFGLLAALFGLLAALIGPLAAPMPGLLRPRLQALQQVRRLQLHRYALFQALSMTLAVHRDHADLCGVCRTRRNG